VRQIRRWRDHVRVPAATRLPARVAADEQPPEFVARLARLATDGGGGGALQTIGPLEILASDEIDAEQAERRIAERRAQLRREVERGQRKLSNEGFVAKAPEDVVAAEREKLDAYRVELAELE